MKPKRCHMGVNMATITVKNIPEQTYSLLKQLASYHRRSINSEIIYLIEKFTGSSKVSPQDHLLMAKNLRNKTRKMISAQEITNAINEGRP